MTQLVSEHQIAQFLETHRGWRQVDSSIVKSFEFPGFPEAVAFVDQLIEPAEAAGHHPDVSIRYNQVTLKLWTHDAGGLTQKDFELAQVIDSLTK